MVGMREGKVVFTPLGEFPDLIDGERAAAAARRWWMALRPLADMMASAE